MTRDFTATTFVVHCGRVLLHRHAKLGKILPPGGHIEANELPEEAALREVYEETGLEVELLDGAGGGSGDADGAGGGAAGRVDGTAGPVDGTASVPGAGPTRPADPAEDARYLVMPVTLLLEDIAEDHQHIDLIYFGVPRDEDAAARIPGGPAEAAPRDAAAGDAAAADTAARNAAAAEPPGAGEFYWLSEEELDHAAMPPSVRDLSKRALSAVRAATTLKQPK
jgi:8-oxo-dGTP pyrophosphatase MutT (NUDIX family)